MNTQSSIRKLTIYVLLLFQGLVLWGNGDEPVQGSGVPSHILGVLPQEAQGAVAVRSWAIEDIVNHTNVKTHGATGDGVTDDTLAIQAALDDEKTNTIYFPDGTYKISAALVLKRGGLRIVGQSKVLTIIRQTNKDANVFELGPGQINLCSFERMKLIGEGLLNSTGAAFYMQSQTPGQFSIRHRWQEVQVVGFNKGWHAYWIPLATWINCQSENCLVGWHLNRCDTPLLLGCGSQASAPNSTEACVRSIGGGFSGQIINGEWGNSKRVFDFQKGNWQVIGGNIETNTEDGVIFVGQAARLDMQKLRVSLPNPTIANSAVIVLDGEGPFPPQMTLGDIFWDAASWRQVAVRGSRYFQVKPAFIGSERNTRVHYEASFGGETYLSRYPAGMAIWPYQEWRYSVPNSEFNNEQRRGIIAMFSVNNNLISHFEHPVAFVRTRWGTHERGSLLNDRLMDVLHTKEEQVGNVGAVETDLLSENIRRYTHNKDGDVLTMRATGTTAANGNNKSLKVYFGGLLVFDSGTKTWNDKAYDLEARVSRRRYNQWVVSTKLQVDGEFPMIKSFSGNTSFNGNNLLRLTAKGQSGNDLVSDHIDVIWRRSDADD